MSTELLATFSALLPASPHPSGTRQPHRPTDPLPQTQSCPLPKQRPPPGKKKEKMKKKSKAPYRQSCWRPPPRRHTPQAARS
eukprot:3645299-Rhodomonas_salina.1